MKFNTQDPDLETIIRRIRDREYDLQPDFQRGDVWTLKKQQRLIDTILRSWHIPPVHLVGRPGGLSDVLDGQQRLTAIRDFMDGLISVDGKIDPVTPEIEELHGLRFEQLPAEVKRSFRRFTIRVFELTDFSPDEPHELFFRLNQPTNLTEAEKRNAFIGGPRNQIKELVEEFSARGLEPHRIGFSNARMAYDDLVGRFLLTLESVGLTEKITAGKITARYRQAEPFPEKLISVANGTLSDFLAMPMLDVEDKSIRPNKATIHSWLLLISQFRLENPYISSVDALADGMAWIEEHRWNPTEITDEATANALRIFHDRSTARVGDVSSVVLRDLTARTILHLRGDWVPQSPGQREVLDAASQILCAKVGTEKELYNFAQLMGWGEKWQS